MTSTQGASQKSQRYFYTDALAAAWMTKHFGMRFQAIYVNTYKTRDYDTVDEILSQTPTVNLTIHPESLHLLEPMVGDLTTQDYNRNRCFVVREDNATYSPAESVAVSYAAELIDKRFLKIILRNGKPFMWPEQEPE